MTRSRAAGRPAAASTDRPARATAAGPPARSPNGSRYRHPGGEAVTVALRLPPPLETPLDVDADRQRDRAPALDGRTVAEARLADADADTGRRRCPTRRPPTPRRRTPGHRDHPFPSCFACGPAAQRATGCGSSPAGPSPATGAERWPRTLDAVRRQRARSPGRRWTVPAAGRATSTSGRWCSAR